MGVQLVNDEDPCSAGIGVDRLLDMLDEINLGSGWSDGWGQDLPCGDVKVTIAVEAACASLTTGDVPVGVRSSTTAEDLPDLS